MEMNERERPTILVLTSSLTTLPPQYGFQGAVEPSIDAAWR